jgi:hypothetical protein
MRCGPRMGSLNVAKHITIDIHFAGLFVLSLFCLFLTSTWVSSQSEGGGLSQRPKASPNCDEVLYGLLTLQNVAALWVTEGPTILSDRSCLVVQTWGSAR